jgi:TRAP-type C4-dicarboxylate transport system permease small subunit
LRTLGRCHDGLLTAFGWLAGLIAVLIGAGVSLDVGMRYFGSPGLPWMLEASEYGLYLLTFFGAPWALREKAHVSIDIAVEALPAKARRAAEIVTDVLGLAISAVLAFYALRVAYASWARGAMVYKELVFPDWWLLALLPVSLALVAIEFVRRLLKAA